MESANISGPGTSGSTPCPACGTALTGPFCHHCGAGAAGGEPICPSCRQASKPGSRFCSHCGTGFGASRPGAVGEGRGRSPIARFAPWLLGGALGAVVLALLLRQPNARASTAGESTRGQPGATADAGVPPDISSLSPRERFIRLYDRVIAAAQSGDKATVERFTPMAFAAYGMLEKIDADARYHLAMIQLHVGDSPGAQAQADSLMKLEPDHLFGYVVDAAVARWNQNEAERTKAYQAFLSRYDQEMKTAKPEYLEHQKMLEQVRDAASGKK